VTVDETQVRETLLQERVVAVVRHENAVDAHAIASSCLAAGMRAIEITLTTPDACQIIAELVARNHTGAVIGAGTVLRAPQVDLAVDAGAGFLVAPLVDQDVLAIGRHAQILTIPGAMTPSEVGAAHAQGATIVKVFPAGSVGHSFAAAIRSVLPDVHLMPTGGLDEAHVQPWLAAGAGIVGVSSALNRVYSDGGGDAVEGLARRLAGFASRAQPEPSTHR
jgi:2-dehydro-3-deoxyphosphogluconate aldolase / (4S)-4-hydroxy-2-oxoglutarate aldolase